MSIRWSGKVAGKIESLQNHWMTAGYGEALSSAAGIGPAGCRLAEKWVGEAVSRCAILRATKRFQRLRLLFLQLESIRPGSEPILI